MQSINYLYRQQQQAIFNNNYLSYNFTIMQQQKKFKSQTFTSQSQEYLYQLHINGENSILKIFSNQTKLRSIQRLSLPKSTLSLHQHYILALTPSHLHLYSLPIPFPLSHENPSITSILHVHFNASTNLLFFLDGKQHLYYIMPEISEIRVKKLLQCSAQGINGKVSQIGVDSQGIVYMLQGEKRILYGFQFDWNKGDRKVRVSREEGVVWGYWRGDWAVKIYGDKENIERGMEEGEGNRRRFKVCIENQGNVYKNYVPAFRTDQQPIIKGNQKDLVYLDCHSRTILAIYNGDQIYQDDINAQFPTKYSPNQFLFQISKKGHGIINFKLHFFQGLRQPFQTLQLPLKEYPKYEQQQSLSVSIHNNIHLILTPTGLSIHFEQKILEYLELPPQSSNSELAYLLLSKLLKKSPLTCTKLLTYFLEKRYRGEELKRYVSYLGLILNDFVIGLQEEVQSKAQNMRRYGQGDGDGDEGFLLANRGYLGNIVQFAAMLYYVVGVSAVGERYSNAGNGRLDDMVNENINCNFNNLQNNSAKKDLEKYYRIVQKSKSIFILNQIAHMNQKTFTDKMQILSQINYMENKEYQGEQKHYKDQIRRKIKVGKQACHQFFNEELASQPKFEDIITYLSKCENFYHAAYFYIFVWRNKESIPYVTDLETVQLIKFLVDSSAEKVFRNRQTLRQVIKSLPKMTSKALYLNEPSFLQYLLTLSINLSQQTCAQSILFSLIPPSTLSSVPRRSPRPSIPISFLIHSLILTNNTLLAYHYVSTLPLSQQQKQQYIDELIEYSIKNRKIKDLLQISVREPGRKIHEKLRDGLGEGEVEEIVQLVEQLGGFGK